MGLNVNRIKEYRKKANLSQQALGDAMKPATHKSTISNYENFRREPGIQTIYQILSVLNKHGSKCAIKDVFPELKRLAA